MASTSAVCSTPAFIESPRLSKAIQSHLGLLLGHAYTSLPVGLNMLPAHISSLAARLTGAIALQTDRDEKDFQLKFVALRPNLQRFAASLTRDDTKADDLVQETLLRAWRSRSRFEPGTNIGAWLFTIMRNTFYSNCSKAARQLNTVNDEQIDTLVTVPEQMDHLELQDTQIALAKLPPNMRQALTYVAIDSLSYEDAAQRIGCEVGTVKSRVWRARAMLIALLGKNDAEFGADHVTMSVVNGSRRVATSSAFQNA